MADNWISIIAMIVAAVTAVGLILLYKRGFVTTSGLEALSALLKDVDVSQYSNVDRLKEYAKMAVDAVEQMAKSGAIQPDNETKKQIAMNTVQHMALADKIDLTRAEMTVADSLVEAAVYNLPRNHPPLET